MNEQLFNKLLQIKDSITSVADIQAFFAINDHYLYRYDAETLLEALRETDIETLKKQLTKITIYSQIAVNQKVYVKSYPARGSALYGNFRTDGLFWFELDEKSGWYRQCLQLRNRETGEFNPVRKKKWSREPFRFFYSSEKSRFVYDD
jgi:hypothetical protein